MQSRLIPSLGAIVVILVAYAFINRPINVQREKKVLAVSEFRNQRTVIGKSDLTRRSLRR